MNITTQTQVELFDCRPLVRYLYHKGNFDGLRMDLANIDWHQQLDGKSMEEAWSIFKDNLDEKMTNHIPKSNSRGNKRSKKAQYLNKDALAKVKAKLIGDEDIWSTNVDVKTVQCNVILVGIVGSKEEITKAISHAKSVEGARKVTSYLRTAK